MIIIISVIINNNIINVICRIWYIVGLLLPYMCSTIEYFKIDMSYMHILFCILYIQFIH